MKIVTGSFLLIILLSSFYQIKTLTGKWDYAGDIFNGKKEAAPAGYTLQRNYADTGFTAYVLEKGYKPEKYETGNYSVNKDSCLETQTWCSQNSDLIGITVHYHYSFREDTLVLKGILPNGTNVEEYWKRVK